MTSITFRRLSHAAFGAWLLFCGTATGPFTQAKPTVIKVVDRGNKDAGIPAVDVRVLIGGKVVDKGITNGSGEFSTSAPRVGQVVTFEYEKLTYLKAPERKEVAIKQPGQQVAGALIRANDVKMYYAGLGNRIDQLSGQLPESERAQFKTEELGRVMTLSYENRQVVAQSLSPDLQADLKQIGTQKTYIAALPTKPVNPGTTPVIEIRGDKRQNEIVK